MAWVRRFKDVEVYWPAESRRWGYKRFPGWHYMNLWPGGLVIRWRRRTRASRRARRVRRWDAMEVWMVRCAVAVFVGVIFGLFLVWLRGQR